ncbi:MAG: DHH family phosphoesterase [Acidimicrobiales bacterium]
MTPDPAKPDTAEQASSAACSAISGAEEVALACHKIPDGDALGSMLAMHHLCRANGKRTTASWPEPFVAAPHYRSLPGLCEAVPPAVFPEQPRLMMTFDCGSLTRLGELAAPARRADQLIVVDHHASNDWYGSINVVDPDAAATAVLVRRLAARLGWSLTRNAALCLYAGLVTDTGRFTHPNTTPEVFALAHELSCFDLPIPELTRQLFEEHSFSYLQLLSSCISRAELDPVAHLVSSWVPAQDLLRYGVTLEETEGLIDILRRAAEAGTCCVAKEAPEGCRVSLRSRDGRDVGAVARALGGGGHRFAAAFVWAGTAAEAIEAVRRELVAMEEPSWLDVPAG